MEDGARYVLVREKNKRWVRKLRLRTPRRHGSDHRAVIVTMRGGNPAKLKEYRRKRRTFPINTGIGPLTEIESQFAALTSDLGEPTPRERTANKWISEETCFATGS